jgi:exonuclease III
VACLQETKLSKSASDPKIPGYAVLRQDRSNHGGGIAILIKDDITFKQIKLPQSAIDPHIESQAIEVAFDNGPLTLVNAYIPPVSSCGAGYKPTISHLLSFPNAVIMGDFNAHDELWYSSISDSRGSSLAEEIGQSLYGVLNQNTPTRVPINGDSTSPDFTLASCALLIYIGYMVR